MLMQSRYSLTSSVQYLTCYLQITLLLTGLKENHVAKHTLQSVSGVIMELGNEILSFTIWFTGFSVYDSASCSDSVSPFIGYVERAVTNKEEYQEADGLNSWSSTTNYQLCSYGKVTATHLSIVFSAAKWEQYMSHRARV